MRITLIIALALLSLHNIAQQDSIPPDSLTNVSNGEKVKTGFNIGGVPAIAYDTDLGFLYGVVLNLYHYGDGRNYPMYNHSIYMEWSRTTKGSGKNIIEYDARNLIPNTRMNFELSYLTEQALDFYGFNGYNSYYGAELLDIDDTSNYISRLYYRYERKMLRTGLNFQGNLGSKKYRWLAGATFYNMNIGSVDINKLNKGKENDELLPDTASIYDKYVAWGVIPKDQATGGNVILLNAGFVYDTRDIEASPNKGCWSEVLFQAAPGFMGNDYAYTRIMLTHRQYLSVIRNKLIVAYRASLQTKLSGEMPFYMLPFHVRSNTIKDGLGGAKTLRGIRRNRVVGDGVAFGNIELRWTFWRFMLFNQNISATLSGFTDAGQVVVPYEFDKSGVNASFGNTKEENLESLQYASEKLHVSYGVGLHAAMNTNFVVAIDYGLASNPQDGTSGLYIGLNYIF